MCVIFSGSVTWPPFRDAIPDYLSFAKQYSDEVDCYFVHIKEAHFVERDKDGKIVDGWPIGYYEYEYPQHKSTEERRQMAANFRSKYDVP